MSFASCWIGFNSLPSKVFKTISKLFCSSFSVIIFSFCKCINKTFKKSNFCYYYSMQIKKNLLGHTWKSRKHTILVTEENAELLKKAGADVFDEVKEDAKQPKEVKPKLKKYKGVKKNDVSDTEK